MPKLKHAVAFCTLLAVTVLTACSGGDTNAVGISGQDSLAESVLNNMSQSGMNGLQLVPMGEEQDSSMLDLFAGLNYSKQDILNLGFQYSVAEPGFSRTGLTLNPSTGELTGRVLPDSQTTEEVISTSLADCLGTGTKTYTLRVVHPQSARSITKSFDVTKNCDGCGNLAPYALY